MPNKFMGKLKALIKSALLKDSLIYVLGEMTAKAVPFLLLPKCHHFATLCGV